MASGEAHDRTTARPHDATSRRHRSIELKTRDKPKKKMQMQRLEVEKDRAGRWMHLSRSVSYEI